MKKIVILLLVFTLASVASGCISVLTAKSAVQERVLEKMDRLWIPENEESIPFLVLEKTEHDYLFIREHTTGPCAFVYRDSPNSYYANSALDDYLNTEYAGRFSSEVYAYILESDVVITKEFSIGCCGGETETIQRIFFVPSWTETTGMYNSIGLKEGNLFSKEFKQNYLATTNDIGEPSAWRLRTPNTWDFNRVFGINEDGGVSSGSTVDSFAVYEAEVRPVFRVSTAIPIVYENEQWYMRINTE
jgi:hypothetical protein